MYRARGPGEAPELGEPGVPDLPVLSGLSERDLPSPGQTQMRFFRNWYYLYMKRTSAEAALESELCKLGVPYRIEYPFPHLRRVVDFALPGQKIVIEVDGASHNDPVQAYKDLASTIALEKLGWAVIRFTNVEVLFDPKECVQDISRRVMYRRSLGELAEALRQLPEPSPSATKRRRPSPKPRPKKAQKSDKG